MGRAEVNQVSSVLFNIPAGSVVDGVYTKYIDVREYKRASYLVNWTSGASGTLSMVFYATNQEFKNETDAELNDVGNIFINVSSNLVGTAALVGESMTTDSLGITGCYTFLKVIATIADSDSSTELYARINRTY